MIRSLQIATFLSLFTLVAFAGEWSQEEIELEEKERKEYEFKSQEYKKKGTEYKLLLEIGEKDYDAKCGNDVFLVSGYIRWLYCHAQTIISYKGVSEWVGADIFVSGPHTNTKLNLKSNTSFGHYNIEFIRKFRKKLDTLLLDEQFVSFTKKVYSKMYSSFRNHYVAYLILEKDAALKDDLLSGYREAISQGRLKRRHYTQTSKSGQNNYYYFPIKDWAPELSMIYNFDEVEVQQDIFFWLRREMDDTASELFSMLSDVIKSYDGVFFDESMSITNGNIFYEISKTLEKKFSRSALNQLTDNQLRILRNSILATCGYKFQDYKLKYYFSKNIRKFCRNNQCGIISSDYSDDLLTNTDLENIKLIRSIEANRI
jgi:hypothetical protein